MPAVPFVGSGEGRRRSASQDQAGTGKEAGCLPACRSSGYGRLPGLPPALFGLAVFKTVRASITLGLLTWASAVCASLMVTGYSAHIR
jgi:hypothetical protein